MMLTLGMTQSVSLQQRLHLTQAQRQAIQTVMIQVRIDLHDAVHERRFDPKAQCPNCLHQLTTLDMLKGFTSDPVDLTTRCPRCKHRFSAHLYTTLGSASSMQLSFYCPMQTTNRLRTLDSLDFETIKKKDPSIFYSALFHFGTLQNAFKQNGTEYPEDPKPQSWQERIECFLGKLSDKDIAEVVGVEKKEITSLRKKRGISAFRQRDLVDSE